MRYRQYELETVVGFFKSKNAAGRSKYVYDPCDRFGSIGGVCREEDGKLQSGKLQSVTHTPQNRSRTHSRHALRTGNPPNEVQHVTRPPLA